MEHDGARGTCEDVSTEHGQFECSECGCKVLDVSCITDGELRFCPDCGRWVDVWD